MYNQIIKERLAALELPLEIDANKYTNLLHMYDDVIGKYRTRPAFTSLGRTITFDELDQYANAFAAYIQHQTDLKVGDRIAIQLPNIIQYPVAVLGALRAGLVVVNTNPLYTERELEHQLNDSGAKALLVLANVAHTATHVVKDTKVTTIIVTELADLHPAPKRQLLNFVIKHIKKMVPSFSLPTAIPFNTVLERGKGVIVRSPNISADDVAVLQYTGGTTGVAKGAMLTHRNIIANTLQSAEIFQTYGLSDQGDCMIQPLPLYHIYAVIVCYITMMNGAHTVLIPNPRDQKALVKELSKWKFDGFCGLNTLFVALCNNADFKALDFSSLKMTLSGGMALTRYAAEEWQKITGCEIYEGYGLTEASPVISVNSGNGNRIGTIGVPLPSTEIDIRDDQDKSVAIGEPGELCVKGPQVMKGYWHREDETAKTIKDGWLYTGDVAIISDDGYLKIVDRKKELIIVSGFNVYPNEVEGIVSSHPAILEAAAVGLPDDKSGEIVCVYAIKAPDAIVTESDVIAFCREDLAAYKVPKYVVFVTELPKSNVGKVLRREVKTLALAANLH
jgi:long-chain acyl-CoA synthetase